MVLNCRSECHSSGFPPTGANCLSIPVPIREEVPAAAMITAIVGATVAME